MTYITLTFPFNVCCDVAKRFSSTAWLFKIATHKLLNIAKHSPVLPGTDIGWKNTFRESSLRGLFLIGGMLMA